MIDTKQIQAMAELRRALQIFATTLYADDEAAGMAVVEPLATVEQVKVEVEEVVVISTLLVLHLTILQDVC